jgi:cytochrome c oxidase cbb3-type subunit III
MRTALALALVLLGLTGCERELRKFSKPSGPQASAESAPKSENQPGQPGKGLQERLASNTYNEKIAYDVASGKRLFRWYNCAGCHSMGGGGMGPPLMDDKWIYGHEPRDIYATIMDGRPNGMPAFRGRIPEDQVWQIVGYVRSMSGLIPADALPGRADSIGAVEPELRRDRQQPKRQEAP